MKVVSPEFVKDKRVLLRLDIDVPIEHGMIVEDFRLKAGIETLRLCLDNAKEVIAMGHIGRPEGGFVKELSVEPIYDWFDHKGFGDELSSKKLRLLENLRFEKGEESQDEEYANQLVALGDVFVNESFATYNPATSTTLLATKLPHAAGIRFDAEVKKLLEVRDNPKKPLIALLGGAKVKDKMPVIEVMAKSADFVLVGGKLAAEIKEDAEIQKNLPHNVMVAELTPDGFDINDETVRAWKLILPQAKMIVWNGPLGKVEDPKYGNTLKIAEAIIDTGAETVIGGGDSVAYFNQHHLLNKFSFVSTGGGAMLKLLSNGTLPTIEALT